MFDKNEIEELLRVVKALKRRVKALETKLAEKSAAEEILEKKRELKRLQQKRYRSKKRGVDTAVDTTVDTTKEEEKGKEKHSPHTPYEEKGEKEEENAAAAARARGETCIVPDEQLGAWCRQFVAAYPKGHRVGHFLVENHLKTILRDAHEKAPGLFDEIMASLDGWKKSEQWTETHGKFITNMKDWVLQDRWRDEIREEAPYRKNRRPNRLGDCEMTEKIRTAF